MDLDEHFPAASGRPRDILFDRHDAGITILRDLRCFHDSLLWPATEWTTEGI
jgi:hypothetical protein